MATLREKVMSGMSAEEKCDVLCSLIDLITQNQTIAGDPDEIELDEDNHVTIRHLGQGLNLAMLAPEIVSSFVTGANRPEIGRDQAWFTLGMLAYFLFYREEYYLKNNVRLLELDRFLEGRSFVIGVNETGGIPFGKAVSQMTAVDPGARTKGVVGFTKYLKDNMPGTAEISYVCDGRQVGTERREVRGTVEDLVPGGLVTFEGMRYQLITQPVKIPYRPGRHAYTIEVKEHGRANANYGRWLFADKSDLTGSVGDTNHLVKVMSLNDSDYNNQFTLHGRSQIKLHVVLTDGSGTQTVRGSITQELPEGETRRLILFLRYVAQENILMTRVMDEQGQPVTNIRRVQLGDRA